MVLTGKRESQELHALTCKKATPSSEAGMIRSIMLVTTEFHLLLFYETQGDETIFILIIGIGSTIIWCLLYQQYSCGKILSEQ